MIDALRPLAARVCPWLVDDPSPAVDGDRDGDDEVVRAMTLVLRIERDPAPRRSPLLEGAAAAALALCLDERAAPGGEWHDAVAAWAGEGRIRKLVRRARTAHWRAVDAVEGLTVARDGTEVRALVPQPVDDVVHEVRRLQIGGTDLPADTPDPPAPGRPVVWLNPDVEQSTGKAAAQVGHGSMVLGVVLAASGRDPGAALDAAVRVADPGDWRRWTGALHDDASGRAVWEGEGVVPVRDAGFTEVAPGTVTCVGQLR